MKKISVFAQSVVAWVRPRVDARDLVAAAALAIAYDGACSVFGVGWARLGVGAGVLGIYALAEAVTVVRTIRGQSGAKR